MPKMPLDHYNGIQRRAQCLVDRAGVEDALDRMAATISDRLADADPILLPVAKGGLVTAGLLLPRLDFPLRLDYLHATRYRDTTRGGELSWHYRPTETIRDEHCLVIDDIFDEGVTMTAIVAACQADGAASVTSAVLVDKRRERPVSYRPDILGLQLPDRYLMGFGLDYQGYFRNAPGIYAAAAEDC